MCPLCGQRKARRACPALGQEICAICCGTKRLTEIRCPSDCGYLTTAREHPPAVAVRRQQHDLASFVQVTRDFNERQSNLFLLVATFLVRYPAPDLQPLIDADVGEAAAALAATYETAARGVIYDHRPASRPAERLAGQLKAALAEATRGSGTSVDRDMAVVLRRIEEGIGTARAPDPANRRGFLELLGRVVRRAADADPAAGEPRLILPGA